MVEAEAPPFCMGLEADGTRFDHKLDDVRLRAETLAAEAQNLG